MTTDTPVFDVPWLSAFGSRLLAKHGNMLENLGILETRLLRHEIAPVDTSRPVFVCGLARSGTTVLIELIASHGDVASQRYLDFPFVFTPFLWNRYLGLARRRPAVASERSHKDGLLVSAESPEAMEEPIWMRFFPDVHEPGASSILDASTHNVAFEAFYDAHMAKLLAVRNRTRYAAKGNYHVARLRYLKELYPNARFIVPVRDPVMHIASSMKQHALFCRGQEENPQARLYLSQVGHFEFGLDRRPINLDADRVRQVLDLWTGGDEVGGWAHYWSMVHNYLAELLEASPDLRESVYVLSYEGLCRDPGPIAERVRRFCGLDPDAAFSEYACSRIKSQDYYRQDFPDRDLERIQTIAGLAFDRLAVQFHAAG